jgi:hypothetical protein
MVMATAAKRSSPWRLPGAKCPGIQGAPGNDPLMFNPKFPPAIALDDGSEHQLPVGLSEIRVQNRMCGDFYCFIGGGRPVSAVGPTLDTAFLNALAQVSA